MRPVVRGAPPTDGGGGVKVFSKYSKARADLIARLGEYCSYCEMHLDASLAVEHVRPKTHNPGLALSWGNFLLGCANCNSTKGSQNVVLADYFWPDVDNTTRAIDYREGGLVVPAAGLDGFPAVRANAVRTIELTGLDKVPGNDPEAKDRRWINRLEAWGRASRALRRLRENDTPQLRDQIVDNAQDKGFWSIWMTVFREEKSMQLRFVQAFPGTAEDCFDADLNRIPRPGGNL